MARFDDIESAAHAWVGEFNVIPFNVIKKLWEYSDYSDFNEVTPHEESGEDEYWENYEDVFPMWGWMWAFNDSADEYWLESLGGLQAMADCGFRIYESEDWGYVFGIDGAGYDFYEAHWIPLYKARGLRWHKEAVENDG